VNPRELIPVALPADFVKALLPQRAPLLLVDCVTGVLPRAAAVRATRDIAPEEPVFTGHFPGDPVWPGAYTIEGLAQACLVAGALAHFDVDLLRSWKPGQSTVPAAQRPAMGLLAAVDVKLTRPVLPGQRLEYWVARTHVVDALHRFEVEATVDGKRVAAGTLTTALKGTP